MILLTHTPYLFGFILMAIALYAVITRRSLTKKLIGLAMFQTSALLFYIAMGVAKGGSSPIYKKGIALYHNPVPHVLMLTAIVVGLATLSVGLAIAVRVKEHYKTTDESEILE